MAQQAATQISTAKIVGSTVLALVLLCLLLLASGYRVLIGETKPPPFKPEMSGPPQWIGNGNTRIDARLLPPFGRVIQCRYFTGRSVTTMTFDASEIDSCPFAYKPKEYEKV